MKFSTFEILGAGRRGGGRGLRGLGTSQCPPPPPCPPCEKTWVGWYVGSAIGAVSLAVILVRAVAQP